MIEFHDPRGVSTMATMPYDLGIELKHGTTVAFLANGFPDSVNFLEAIEVAIKEYADIRSKYWNKGDDSIPAGETMLAEINQSCQAAISAYGH